MTLTSGDFNVARRTQQGMMTDRIAIERATNEQDVTGGVDEVFAVAYRDVAARIAPADERGSRLGSERVFSSRIMQEADFVLSVAHDQDLRQADKVRFNGELYDILGVSATSTYLTAKRAMLRRVR